MSNPKLIHVVVGVLVNPHSKVLISFRHKDLHQGGLWEFPGGKVEQNESPQEALCREFKEELGIELTVFAPFTEIEHAYPDKKVLLDVWRISAYSGNPSGIEGQAIEWRPVSELRPTDFPKANEPIIRLLKMS